MDSVDALVSIYYKTPVTSAVIHQGGVKFGDYVITVANKFFTCNKASLDFAIKKISVTYRNNDNNVEEKCRVACVWQSVEVKETLSDSFTLPEELYDKIQYRLSGPDQWPYFVLLECEKSVKPLDNITYYLKKCSPTDLKKGLDVLVSYTPFGSISLLNTMSEGIISNMFGKNNTLFLTDARLASPCEGSPVYRNCNSKNILIGILIKNIPYSNGGIYHQSGFSVGVNISVLLNSLQNNISEIKYRPETMNLTLPVLRDSILKTDFVVTIEMGAGKGTGVIIHESGLVMTCAHVINFEPNIETMVRHEDCLYNATVLFSTDQNCALDIAFIAIHSTDEFPSCQLGSTSPKKGELLYSLGQGELLNTFLPFVSKGIVSHFQHLGFLVTSCLILRGSSGGVVVRPNGEVIGLITSMLMNDEISYPFLSFCIPVYHFQELIQSFITTRDTNILVQMIEDKTALGWKRPKL